MSKPLGDNILWRLYNGLTFVTPTQGTVYVYGINLISSRNNSGNEKFYLYNAHGDVVQLVDDSGTITKTYSYDAFGVEHDIDTNDTNYFRYAGQYFDIESGTYYLRARYYNPANGRFTQQDGWGFGDVNDPLSLNLYTYCMSNPILMVDINGHWPSWGQLFQAAAIVVGTVVVVAAVVATAGAAATAVGMAAGMYATALGATAATAGAVTAVATTAATVGAYAVAAGKVATAASNIGEVFTGHNVIRDDLMGGNQEAYDMLNIAIDMVGIGIVELGSNNNANAAPSAKADKGTTDNTQGAGKAVKTDFVVTPKGEAIPIPKGATGPVDIVNPAGKTTGFGYTGGSGGANGQVSNVRIMDPTPPRGNSPGYPNGYVKYENKGLQGVDPITGRTLPNSRSHFPLR